jgi:hypothetical protein
MPIFHKFNAFYREIISESDFNLSQFSGCEELLECSWEKLIIASEKEDDLSEMFSLIEDCGEYIRSNENMSLYEMSDNKIILYDDYDDKAIIIHKKDKENLESFI